MLRSLLTICNCQMHKKFATVRGGGVDSFREWQLSYRWIMSSSSLLARVPVFMINRLEAYELFDQQPTVESEVWGEFYSHKIYTTAAITSFFFLLLLAFKHNGTSHQISRISAILIFFTINKWCKRHPSLLKIPNRQIYRSLKRLTN